MIFGGPTRIVLCLLTGDFGGPDRRSSWCTFDYGVACGTSPQRDVTVIIAKVLEDSSRSIAVPQARKKRRISSSAHLHMSAMGHQQT